MLVRTPRSAFSPLVPQKQPSPVVASGQLVLRIRGGEHHGRVVQLSAPECSLGSAEGNTLRLRCRGVEPRHARLVRSIDGCRVEALATVFLNGAPIQTRQLLRGDLLSIGPVEFEVLEIGRFECRVASPPQTPQSSQLPQLPQAPTPAPLQLPPAARPSTNHEYARNFGQTTPENVSDNIQNRLIELESLLAAESERAGSIHRERDAATQEINQLTLSLSQLHAVSKNLTQERDQLRESLNQHHQEFAQLAGLHQHEQSLHATARQALGQTTEQLVGLQQQFKSELERFTAHIAQLETQLSARDQSQAMLVSEFQYREEAAVNRTEQLARQLSELDRALLETQQRLQAAESANRQIEQERERFAAERDSLALQQQALKARNHELTAALDREESLAAEAATRQNLAQAEITNLTAQLAKRTAVFEMAESRLAQIQCSNHELTAALDREQSLAAEAAARQNLAQAEIANLTAQLADRTAAAEAAESRLTQIQCSNHELTAALDREQSLVAEAASRQNLAQAEITNLTAQVAERTGAAEAAESQVIALEAERQLLLESSQGLQQALTETKAALEQSISQSAAELNARESAHEQMLAELKSANADLQSRLYAETQQFLRQGEESLSREIELADQAHRSQRAFADLQLEFRLSREQESAAQTDLTERLAAANDIIALRSQELLQRQQESCILSSELAQARADFAAKQAEFEHQAACLTEFQAQQQQIQQQAEENLAAARAAQEQTLAEWAAFHTAADLRLQALSATLDQERSERCARETELESQLNQTRQSLAEADTRSQFNAERLQDEIHRLAGELLTTKQALQARETALEQLRGDQARQIELHQEQLSAAQGELHRLQQLRQKEAEGWNKARRSLEAESNQLAQELAAREQQWNAIRFTIDNTNLEQQCELGRLQGELTELKARLKADRNDFSKVRSRLEAETAELADRLFQKSTQLQSIQGVASVAAENYRREAEALQVELANLREQFEAELARWTQERSALQGEWSKRVEAAQLHSRELEVAQRSSAAEVARLTGAVELLRSELAAASALLCDDENRRLAERTEWEARLQKIASELCEKQLECEQLRGDHAIRLHQWTSESERFQRELTAQKSQADDQQRLLADLRQQLAEVERVSAEPSPAAARAQELLVQQVQSLAGELEHSKTQLAELQQKRAEEQAAWNQTSLARDARLEDLRAECERREAAIARHENERQAAEQKLAESAQERTAHELQLAQLEEAAAGEREAFSRQLADLQATLAAAQLELTQLREEFAAISSQLVETRAQVQEANAINDGQAEFAPEGEPRLEQHVALSQLPAETHPAPGPEISPSDEFSAEQDRSEPEAALPLPNFQQPTGLADWSADSPSQTFLLPQGSLSQGGNEPEYASGPAASLPSPVVQAAPSRSADEEECDPEFEARLARLLGRAAGPTTIPPQTSSPGTELESTAPDLNGAEDPISGESEASHRETAPVLSILDRLEQSGVWKEPTTELAEEASEPVCSATLSLQPEQRPFASEPMGLASFASEATPTALGSEIQEELAVTQPTPPQAKDGDGDEESINDYMSRLLNRMRGGAPAPAPPKQEKPRPAVAAPQVQALPPEPQAPQIPQKPEEFVPRAAAPEKVDSLKAMREVANSAARGAIAVHSRNRTKVNLASRMLAGAITSMIAAGAIAGGVNSQSPPALVGGLLGLLLGASWLMSSCWEGIRSARLPPPENE